MKKIPKLNRNTILSIFLLLAIIFSIIKIVSATAPDPGHNFSEVGGSAVLGDILYGSTTDTLSALSGNATTTKKFLRMTGTGSAAAAPAWDILVDGDIPSALTGKTYNGLTITANGSNTLNISNGITLTVTGNATISGSPLSNPMTTLGDIIYENSTPAPARLAAGATTGAVLMNTASGAPSWSLLSALPSTAGILPVANGGTGLATLTTGNVILGAGTSNVTFVSPATSGNVLTANGTTWTSAAPSGGGAPTTATYITQTADATLSAEQALSTLATGYMKVTTGTGVITSTGPYFNQSVAAQGAGFASDTYLTGSSITIPSGALKIGTRYHLIFNVSKTAAGTATPIIYIRFGTNGSTADTARLTFTFLAGTAAADIGAFEVFVTFRTVGSGTSAVMQGMAQVQHSLSTTGLQNLPNKVLQVTSAGFDSTVANSIIGASVNGGTSASWTVQLVRAELENTN
jgi:hypothetical protein